MVEAKKYGRNIKTRCIGLTSNLLRRKDWSSIKLDRTLLTKTCCQVSRYLSVMLERRDLFPMSLDHQFQTSGKIHVATQKMCKSRFFWNDNKSNISLIIEQRFKNTNSRPIMTKEVSKSWMESSSLKEEKFIVLIKETNNFDEINNFFMNDYWNKIENFVKLMWKVSTNERTGRLVNSCVPVSVERLDQDKDADENADADQTRTERPVSGQPTGSFTQLEEHWLQSVWIATCSCETSRKLARSREHEEDRKSSSSRRTSSRQVAE